MLLHIQGVMFNCPKQFWLTSPLQGAAQNAAELTCHPNNFPCCRLRLAWQELTQRMPVFNDSKLLLQRQGEGGMSHCQTMLREMQKSSAKTRMHKLQVQICLPKRWLGGSTRDDLDQTLTWSNTQDFLSWVYWYLGQYDGSSQNAQSLENVAGCSLCIRCARQHPQACCLTISLTSAVPFKHYGLTVLLTKSK